MRFCPFCTAENADELATCQACGRRLPPLPPRRRNAPPTGVQLPMRRPAGTTHAPPVGGSVPPSGPQRPPTTLPTGHSAPHVMPTAPAGHSAPHVMPTAPVPPTAAAYGESGPTMISAPPPGLIPTERPRTPTGNSAPHPMPTPTSGAHPMPRPPTQIPSVRRTGTTMPPPLPTQQVSTVTPDRDSVPVLPPPPAAQNQALLDAISPAPSAARRPPPPLEVRAPAEPARRTNDRPPAAMPVAGHRPPAADDFNTMVEGAPLIDPDDPRAQDDPPPPVPSAPIVSPYPVVATANKSGITPPPTRIQRPEALADRPFTPPKVLPVPSVPEPGIVNAARYSIDFWRARYQRRGAIKQLAVEIKQDTEALDQVLGALGRTARDARVDGRVFSAENAAISTAEQRVATLQKEHADVDARKGDENSKYIDVEAERNAKLADAERMVSEAQSELAHLEGLRRGLRDNKKDFDRRQKAYLKAAEDAERQSTSAQMNESRADLRRTAEHHRKEAAALEPERQEIDRKLAQLDRPIGEAAAKLDAAKAELDAAKRSLSDAREGHTHRLAELDAEQKRKAREMAQADAEIQRRLVTLGTLVNLNRIEDRTGEFTELYERIDRIRGAITARTTEIEKLTAERETYDRPTLIRGIAVIGGAIVAFIALIVILRAIIF